LPLLKFQPSHIATNVREAENWKSHISFIFLRASAINQ